MKKRLFQLTAAVAFVICMLTVQAFAMQISVEVQCESPDSEKQTITLEVEPTDRIEDVRAKIQEKTGDDYTRYGFLFVGKLLQDGNTLQDYNIQMDETIQLVAPVTLDISKGSILITSTGYSVNGKAEIPFVGPYILTGTEGSTTNYNVQIESGTHSIILDNLNMDNEGESWGIAIGKKDQTETIHVTMTFAGDNNITAGGRGSEMVPILVLDKCSLTLRGEDDDAVLNVTNTSTGKAAIGGPWDVFQTDGDDWKDDCRGTGSITIESGTVNATGGGNGAAVIGTSGSGNGDNSNSAVTVNGGDLHLTLVREDGYALGGAAGNLTLNGGTITTAGQYPLANGDVVINGNVTFSGAGVTVDGEKKLTVESGGLTVNDGTALTVNGTLTVDDDASLTNQGIVDGNGTVSGSSLPMVTLTVDKTQVVSGENITLTAAVSMDGTAVDGTVTIGTETKPLSGGKAEFIYTAPQVDEQTVQKLTAYYYQDDIRRNGTSTSITIYPSNIPNLDVANGEITVNATAMAENMIVSQNGQEWLVSVETPVVVTGNRDSAAGTVSINIENVSMNLILRDLSAQTRIWITGAPVMITLDGENKILYADEYISDSAYSVYASSSLIINGTGSLTTNGKISVRGNLDIRSGTVYVNIPENKLGDWRSSVAIGTEYGEESRVAISGGTVTAIVPQTSGDYDEFGGNWGIKSGSVIITGGSVSASSISPSPTDGEENPVYPVSLSSLPANGILGAIYLSDGSSQINYGCPTTVSSDGALTLYLPEGTYEGKVLVEGQLYDIKNIVVSDSASSSQSKTTDTGIAVTTPQNKEPSFDNTGRLVLPEGSKVATGGSEGGSAVTLPNGGTVSDDGSITVPTGGSAILEDGSGDTTTITIPDGGSIKPNQDGIVAIPSGSTVQTGNGPQITVDGEGANVNTQGGVTLPAGASVTIMGTDGSTTTVTMPNSGGTIATTEDGTVTIPSGSIIKTVDGMSITVTAPVEGGSITVKHSGETTIPDGGQAVIENENGNKTTVIVPQGGGTVITGANGTVTVPGGSTVQTGEGLTITIGSESGGSVGNDGSVTLPAGGSVTITGTDGSTTTVTIPNSGGAITPNTDGTVTLPGGSTVTNDGGEPTTVPSGGGILDPGTGSVTEISYTVSFNSQGGSAVPSQTVVSGGKATVPTAPTRDGYTFAGWYQDAQGTVAWNFETPVTANLTLYAQWSENSSGGGGSSGGSSASNSGSVTGSGNNVNVDVSGSSVTTAQMETAVERADQGETITIDASRRSSVSLPSGGLEDAAGNENDLTVKLENGDVTLSPEALSAVTEQAGTTVTLTVVPVDTDELNSRHQEAVGDAPVFNLTLRSGSQYITDFDGGLVTVSLPYELPDGQEPDGVVVWYLDDQGNITPCKTMYDVRTETVIFTTNHFSLYVIGYEKSAASDPFTDVSASDWFHDAVMYAYENGLMNGMSENEFRPNATTNRAMVVTILYRLAGSPDLSNENLGYPFADVDASSWYGDAVYWARLNGITDGISNTNFDPDGSITREQMAALLYRYADFAGYDVSTGGMSLSEYADVSEISSYAVTAMQWANENGLLTGRTATTLAPKGTATRAEIATILMRFCEDIAS